MIQVAANALNLNITLYQKNHGKTQVLKYTDGNCWNEISLKFHHDPIYSGFNHYELIVKIKMREDDMKNTVILTHMLWKIMIKKMNNRI